MTQLVLATRNHHKIMELEALLGDIGIKLVGLDQFPLVGEIVEDQPTLEGNALKKAREVHRITRMPALADDSGLEVYYLNGEPGVFSSRYAGPHATYEDNCKKLLEKMRGVPARRRAARFRCVLGLVTSALETTVEGIVTGRIIEHPRGNNGFGYDPVFVPDGFRETLAEMSVDLKNQLSHRSKAVVKMKEILHDVRT